LTSTRLRLPRLTFPELWGFLAVALPVLGSLLAPLSTVDLAYHVRAGGLILDARTLPSPDTFTFTVAGLPWLDQQWGAQVVLAALYRAGGWALLAVVRALVVGLVAWLVLRACRSAGLGLRVAAWLTLGGFVVGIAALGLRPQLLGMVLLALTLAILAVRGRRPGLVWVLPVLVAVWANVHGSFILGPAAVTVAWLEDMTAGRPRPRRLLVVAVVSGLATLVNPYGFGAWSYAAGLTTNPVIRRLITEWQVTSPLSFVGLVFYGSVLAVVALVVVNLRRSGHGSLRDGAPSAGSAGSVGSVGSSAAAVLRTAWPTLLWLVGLAVVGAFAQRGVAWWAIGAPIAVARLVGAQPEALPDAAQPRRSSLNTAIAVVLAAGAVALLPFWRGGDSMYGPPGLLTDAPRGLTEAVLALAGPTDRIWNAQRWGSWLEFAVPAAPVAVDSRIELIPTDAWDDHLALSRGASDWQSILDRRGVTIVVAAADEQQALIPLLRASPSWRVLEADSDGAVFVRVDR
jgi:hypothetical protein